MPVDDENLATMLQSAYEKLGANGEERQQLKIFIQGCTEITMVPTPTEANPDKKTVGKDRLLGVALTTTRRQAIYDKLVTDKATLGL